MASKNPNSEIAAKIVLEGGYDPCKTFPEDDMFWTKNAACDPGLPQKYFSGPGIYFCQILVPFLNKLSGLICTYMDF